MKVFSGKLLIRQQFPDLMFDESRFTAGVPDTLYFPQTQSDVIDIARTASASGKPITLVGAQTGITGGGVPIDDCIAVCFSEMNALLRIDWTDPEAPILYCQPGVTLTDIDTFLGAGHSRGGGIEGGRGLAVGQWIYPPDPTEMSAQLGGTVATNASGARSFFFGPTRRYISALSLIFVDGECVELRRGDSIEKNGVLTFTSSVGRAVALRRPAYESTSVKNASGYYSKKGMDLIDLFIGSEGTLAIFTEIGVRLVKAPRFIGGLSFFPERNAAFGFAQFLRGQPCIAAIEYFDRHALSMARKATAPEGRRLPDYPPHARDAVYWEFMETDAPFEQHLDAWEKALADHGSALDSTWSGFDKKEMDLLKWFRHSVPEMVNAAVTTYKRDCPQVRKISTDAALPPHRFNETIEECIKIVEEAKLAYVLFGHLGDFHLHCNLLPRSPGELSRALDIYDSIMDLAIRRGGTVSAEHGIGKIKTAYCARQYGAEAMEEMSRIKSQLDPQWLLNRGNLFDRLP